MKTKLRQLLRSAYAAPVLAILASIMLPIFTETALAVAPYQVLTRSIQMSSSTTSATSTTYDVTFSESASSYPATIKGIVVDFCSTDPIPGDTCTLPTGFSVASGFTNNGVANNASIAGFTGGTLNSGQTWDATLAGGVATSASAFVFSFNLTATNPSTLGTFYARVFTFTTTAGATGYTQANPNAGGGEQDYGGIALSTASAITVTAKVQEQLTFCVYTGANCGAGGTSVALGSSGILSSSSYWVDNSTKYDIQTNAGSGAVVTAKAPTTLTGPGGATIAALTTATAASAIVGVSDWGMCTYSGTAGGGTSGAFAANANYNGGATVCNSTNVTSGAGTSSAVKYYFNGVASTYGDPIATQGAGSGYTANIVPIVASTAASQAAGIYTMTLQFIATGTF